MINCPACKHQVKSDPSEEFSLIENIFKLFKCSHCDLAFWEPRVMPDAGFYEKLHDNESKARLLRHSLVDYELSVYHKAFFSYSQSGGTLLDIGCGDGRFLEAAKNSGFETWGIDLDNKAVGVACKRGLKNVYNMTLDNFIAKSISSFDTITSFEVLEHQPDPSIFIEKIRDSLSPHGWFYGSVPNRNRWRLSEDKRWDRPPHHFTLWSKDSLEVFLYTHGFGDIKISDIQYGTLFRHSYSRIAAYAKKKMVRELSDEEGFIFFSIEDMGKNKKISKERYSRLKGIKDISNKFFFILSALEALFEKPLGMGEKLFFRGCRK